MSDKGAGWVYIKCFIFESLLTLYVYNLISNTLDKKLLWIQTIMVVLIEMLRQRRYNDGGDMDFLEKCGVIILLAYLSNVVNFMEYQSIRVAHVESGARVS